MKASVSVRIFALSFLICGAAHAQAQTPDGQALFQSNCATCHSAGSAAGAPLPETLRQMTAKSIVAALESGKMRAIGEPLNGAQREAIAKFLGLASGAEAMPASARCSASTAPSKSGAAWNGWADAANTRFQPAKAAGLTASAVPKLKLKWAFGFPGLTTAFATPTVYGGRVFVGSADGTVYSLNASSGCLYWTYEAEEGVRTAVVISNNGQTAYFGDLHGNVHAVNASTGAMIWKTRVDEYPFAVVTGTPKLEGSRLYVGVSGGEEPVSAGNPMFECCKFRGSMVALDAATGKQIWKTYTIAEAAKITGRTSAGTPTWGPAGVSIWSAPTIDLQKKAIYVGTGINFTQPTTANSDAVMAFDMDSGRILWSQQLTPGDAFNFGCQGGNGPNCPKDAGQDTDFGNSGILRSLGNGKRVLVIGQKSGIVHGLDPDQQGKIVWQSRIAAGGPQGGVIWGSASDDKGIAYIGISDWNPGKPDAGGGLVALQMGTGEKLWTTPAPKPACVGTPGCSAAQPAPPAVIPGVVFLGSMDGHMRAYDAKDGKIIWDFDTLRDFQAVNGVKARGGSINAGAPTVAGGMLYINSGYARIPSIPGNVLLAFSVDGK
jgi:polyvinyl alcohol dehydrogenase (cytochrome)